MLGARCKFTTLCSISSKVIDELVNPRDWAGLHVADNSCFHYRTEDGKIVDEKRLNVLLISSPESPESSPINETSKLLQDYEDGEPKDDVVQKHGS
nr:protein prenyltransferase alpha subunit repeat-containing protein 1 isoform X2 [Tanacetum cinerariifolium]